MNNFKLRALLLLTLVVFSYSCDEDDDTSPEVPKSFTMAALSVDGRPFRPTIAGVSTTPEISISFGDAINRESVAESIVLSSSAGPVEATYGFSNADSTVVVKPQTALDYLTRYSLSLSAQLEGKSGSKLGTDYVVRIVTTFNPDPKFEEISDEALLTLVQEQTFRYFWEFGHPASGMARERNTSGDLVTSGGSGFGLMAMVVAIERGFITHEEGVARLGKIVSFLEKADRFHGAWSHWMDGNTGKVIPFSANDNGGDLVETAFLVQGLLTFRNYLNYESALEKGLVDRINVLWKGVEWDWYTRGGQDVLYWHWSPDKEWVMNHRIQGHNETLITYVLAASSPTHPISSDVYRKGYARTGEMRNGRKFYDYSLPLGEDYGGPLFFAHYSFLGLNPRNLSDQYANYWEQNVNHSRINHAYAVANPKKWAGYSADNWGLTASDNQKGYSAHSPLNDIGVITPTAALSSFPYTPEESMAALRFFYYTLGDKLWGEYGFKDAFNLSEPWFADSYLAIDQGPIIVMIENHRTGLVWQLFMTSPEVEAGLNKLGFTY